MYVLHVFVCKCVFAGRTRGVALMLVECLPSLCYRHASFCNWICLLCLWAVLMLTVLVGEPRTWQELENTHPPNRTFHYLVPASIQAMPSHAMPRHAGPGQQQKDPFDHGLGPKGISLDIAPSTSSSTQLLMPVPLASSSPFLICLPLVLPLFLLLPLHYGKLWHWQVARRCHISWSPFSFLQQFVAGMSYISHTSSHWDEKRL